MAPAPAASVQYREAENRGARVYAAPTVIACASAFRALVWNNGRQVWRTSSAVRRSAPETLRPHQTNWAWGQRTPREVPVVPEVKRTHAVSPGRTGAPQGGAVARPGHVVPSREPQRPPVAGRPQALRRLLLREQLGGAGLVQDVPQPAAAQPRVQRDQLGAEPGGAEEQIDEFDPVARHRRDTVARAAAPGREGPRHGGGGLSRLTVGADGAPDPQEGAVPVVPGRGVEQPGNRQGGHRSTSHSRSSRIRSGGSPATSRSTSSVSAPSTGAAVRTPPGVRVSRMGGPSCRKAPATGCSART
ncbi:hypothetical protein SANTM175S_03697 [Streptomyces antimycoticus]